MNDGTPSKNPPAVGDWARVRARSNASKARPLSSGLIFQARDGRFDGLGAGDLAGPDRLGHTGGIEVPEGVVGERGTTMAADGTSRYRCARRSRTARCSSTPSSPAPIVLIETWLAPAARHAAISASARSGSPAQVTRPSIPMVAGSRPAAVAASCTAARPLQTGANLHHREPAVGQPAGPLEAPASVAAPNHTGMGRCTGSGPGPRR